MPDAAAASSDFFFFFFAYAGDVEWLTNQNNLTRAKLDRVIAQYEYVFRMKVLEFYKGQGLRL